MRRFRAAWVLPIAAPPVTDATVTVDRGRILAVGPAGAGSRHPDEVDLGSVAVLPGLVNAHTHLELSGLRGLVPPAESMPAWVEGVLAQRSADTVGDSAAVEAAIAELRQAGTALVGDITNSLSTVGPLGRGPVSAVVFHELIGFAPADVEVVARRAVTDAHGAETAAHVRRRVAAHAPYSVAPSLFAAIQRHRTAHRLEGPLAVHLAESSEEIQFLRDGTGPWRQLLERLGVWDPDWHPPQCGSVEFLARVGWLDPGVVAVHGVQLTMEELRRLARHGLALVVCPRSNAWTGAGRAPVRRALEAGVQLAVGTDSLASAPDLNLFAELAALRAEAPEIPARTLLAAATLGGARALGWAEAYGTIEPGKRSELIAVTLPDEVADVEEYLLSGITPRAVRWLEECA